MTLFRLGLKRLVCLMFILSSSVLCYADAPPTWQDVDILSANKEYRAAVRQLSSDENLLVPSEREYVLRVFQNDGDTLMWSSPYEYDGYADGFLSNDGKVFVYVNYWYQEKDVLQIYQKDKPIKHIDGNNLGLAPDAIDKTGSHEVWIADDTRPEFIYEDGVATGLRIMTRDGHQHTIDFDRNLVASSRALLKLKHPDSANNAASTLTTAPMENALWVEVDGGDQHVSYYNLSQLEHDLWVYLEEQDQYQFLDKDQYSFQYQYQKEDGEEIVYIHAFCGDQNDLKTQGMLETLKEDFYIVDDGGSCYFQIKRRSEGFYDLMVNGEA